jgi:hypothetical protein
MAIDEIRLISVGGNEDLPPTVALPGPWAVVGEVLFSGQGVTITALAYQVNAGAVNGIQFEPASASPQAIAFDLDNTEIPSAGSYRLTLYAWDSANESAPLTSLLEVT